MVLRMSDNSADPSGNTEAFRAFSQSTPQEPATTPSRTPLIIGVAAVVVVILVVLIIWAAS
jgi:hypothetical protein